MRAAAKAKTKTTTAISDKQNGNNCLPLQHCEQSCVTAGKSKDEGSFQMNRASAGGIGIANAQAGTLMQAPAALEAVDLNFVGQAIRESCIERRRHLELGRLSLPTGGHSW